MSLIAQQLNKLKQNNAISIAPGAPKPSLILDKQTARNTTVDVLYTMAVLGYGEIRKQMLHSGRSLGEQLLSVEYKQINRNKLSKEENKALSIKLTRFLLIISPLFLNRGCQAIIEYLLRNFNVHVFESEQLALIFLQYWQHQSYIKLIANIEIKNTNLEFIRNIQQKKQINLTYIIKSLTYSRSLLDSLIMFTKRYIKQQNTQTQQVQIELVSKPTGSVLKVEESAIVKHDIKQFLLEVLSLILQRKISAFNKQICEFCIFASKQQEEQIYSMAMMLSILVLSNQHTHSEWINRVIKNLISKNIQINQNIFNFIMVVWQRWPAEINHDIISMLIDKQHFILRLTEFKKSTYMIFFMLVEYFLQSHQQNKGIIIQIIQNICLKIKQQEFVRVHQLNYFGQIFKLIHNNFEKLEKKEQKIINKFITNLLQYEYAVYVNENRVTPLPGIFTKQQINKNGSINFSNIQQIRQQKLSQQNEAIEQEKEQESQDQQQQKRDDENKQNNSILKVLSSWTKKQIQKFDLSQPEIKNLVTKLINDYYNQIQHINDGKLSLTLEQKNRVLEDPQIFAEMYNLDRFYFDLDRKDYNTCIRYLITNGNVEMCHKVLLKLARDGEAADDLLYRQLCRQAIQKLGSLTLQHYKSVVSMLGKLYHSYSKNIQPELIKPINEMMLKLSTQVIGKGGKQKGKFYKLIAFHARFLAKLTLSLAHRQTYALQTYQKLIDIFGLQNSYCFLIGAAQLLATQQKNKKQFGNFIDKILIPSLYVNNEQQAQPDFIQFKNVLGLFKSFNKCLIFCHYMLEETKIKGPTAQQNGNPQEEKEEEQNKNQAQHIESGVAKKMIVNFFGITSSKNKRAIVRKVFMFLSSIFKSHKLSNIFKQTLSTINRRQELKLSAIASKIYNLLVNIYNDTTGPLKQVTGFVKINLLKLFPLQLKVDVLGPLLPLNQVYAELAHDLEEHSTCKFDNLTHFINIVPHEPSDQWCKFAIQCIKRGYYPTEQNSKQILELNTESKDNTNLVKFICSITEYAREECLGLLEQMMKIIFDECNDRNDYALAILYTITKNLKQFVDPYLSDIFQIGIQIKGEHVNKFIDGIVQAFTAPTLVNLAKNHSKTVQNSQNFTYFLNKISTKVTFESIWKTCQNFFARSLNTLVQQEKSYENLHDLQSQVFINQALKMNDNQLRKIIIDYLRWASQRTNSDNIANLHFNSRKNLILKIFEKLSDKLGDLFTHFYGYIFEDIVKDLKSLSIMQDVKTSLIGDIGKRNRQMTHYDLECCVGYTKQLLNCLRSLFEHDPGNQFMDSIKFDTLAPSIANVFNMVRFQQYYSSIMNDSLKSCLISLFKNTADDYKLKTINTEILRLLRTKNQRITHAIFNFYQEVAGHIQYRFLLFTDQMIPLLIQASSSRNAQIKKSVESIIYKIQNLSGQKIDRMGR